MDATSDTVTLPERPRTVVIGAALLLLAAAVLLLHWVIQPGAIRSNGGQVFFIMLWSVFAYAAFTGLGWVRLAIAAVFGAAIWGAINSGASLALERIGAGQGIGYAIELAALIALCTPTSNQWFAEVADLRKQED